MNTVANPAISRPSLALLGAEPWRAALEFLDHKFSSARTDARGDGHPVVVFPGLASDRSAVAPLLDHCRALGYAATDWGRGYNRGPQGDIDDWLRDLAADVQRLLGGHRQRATLVGWSLGGLYAREIGKLLAPLVRQVITIGTPFNAERDHSNVGWLFRLLNGSNPAIDAALGRRLRQPPPVPTTSIYSRSDGVVAWQTCLHEPGHDHVQDIEISGSHIGMAWNRNVFRVLTERLALHGDVPRGGAGAQPM